MQKLLIVGQGDFSYSLYLAKHFGSDTNITAISLDTPAEARRNSNTGKANVEELERLGCTVVQNVNVDSMATELRLHRYNKIVLDYSHAWVHNDVFKRFMENASKMLKDKNGEIYVTHNTSGPYPRCEIAELAEELSLRVIWKNEVNQLANKRCNSCLGYVFNKGYEYLVFLFNKRAGSTSNSTYAIPKAITFRAL